MITRISIVGVLLLLSAAVIVKATRIEDVPPREPFSRFPFQISSWRGQDTERFSDEVMKVLGADDYLSRFYRDQRATVGLYVELPLERLLEML